MKKQNDTAPEAKNDIVVAKEPDEATSNAKSQVEQRQPKGNKVMATHGFLRILSTIRKR